MALSATVKQQFAEMQDRVQLGHNIKDFYEAVDLEQEALA